MSRPEPPPQEPPGRDLLPGELAPPPPAAAVSQRRAEILRAARRLLEADGREGLTMRRLADELGMQAPSLYKHVASKADLELGLIADGLRDVGAATHEALHAHPPERRLTGVLHAYRRCARESPHLYRLATSGPIDRDRLPGGLEEWAGNPWFVVTGDPATAQALWSFAHGMVILELDDRYPLGSDLAATWEAGARAFSPPAGR